MVGRTRAVETVERALAAARAEQPIHLVISGEAGVGKTRLLEYAGASAAEQGMRFLSGSCFDLGASSLPYAPYADLIRDLIAEEGLPAIRQMAGRDARSLGRLVPVMADAQAEADETPESQRLFEAIRSLLLRAARGRALLVGLEDLHSADHGTLDATRYLMRTLRDEPITVFSTFRDEDVMGRDGMRAWLGELGRAAGVERLTLEPLDRDQMDELVRSLTGTEPGRDLLDAVFARSDGNPFFAEELLAAPEPAAGPLPASLHDVLTERAGRVPADARRLLAVASIGGLEIEHDLLVAAAGLDDRTATDHLATLVEARLLVPVSGSSGEGYRFRHAILAEVVADGLLPIERRKLHAAFAAEMERRGSPSPQDALQMVAFAYHLREAGDPRALEASVRSGDAATRAVAMDVARAEYEHALRLFDAATERGETVDPGVVPDRSALLGWIANAAYYNGDYAIAESTAEAAIAEADGLEPHRAVSLWVRLGEAMWRAGHREAALDAMRTAVDLAPHDAEEARVRALAGLAQVEMLIGEMPAARAHATLAVDLARRSELRRLESHALCTLGVVLASLGDVRAGIDAGSQALLMARELGSVDDIGRAYVNLVDVHWMAADPETALNLAQEAISDIRLRGLDAGYLSEFGYGAVLAAYDIGDWELARRLLEEADRRAAANPAVELYRAEYSLAFLVGSGAPDAESTWRRGLELAAQQISDDQQTLMISAGVELLTRNGQYEDAVAVATGRLPEAERLESWVVFQGLVCSTAWPLAELVGQARATADRSAERAALERLDQVADLARRGIDRMRRPDGDLGVWLDAQVQQIDAEIARARRAGSENAASVGLAWASVAEAWASLGRPYRVAYARWRQGQALLGTDARAAAVALEQAWHIALRLGAKPMLGDLRRTARGAGIRLVESTPADRPRSTSGPFGLSARELEVLGLIVAGRSNREIAEELYISKSTAGVHVSNILGKLGVRSRVEATRLAITEGIVGAA